MSIDLCDEEGGGTVELVTNGKIFIRHHNTLFIHFKIEALNKNSKNKSIGTILLSNYYQPGFFNV